MSLINDALKRAKQAHTENPSPTPDLPFRPADPAHARTPGVPMLPLGLLAATVLLGGGLILLALLKRDAPQVVHATPADATTAPASSPDLAAPVTSTPAAVPVVQSPTAAKVDSPAPTGSTPEVSVATPVPEPPKPVPPKLQGIFYNPTKPAAVVGGKSVYVGSRVGEARDFLVLEITRESVTVANGSQTNVLVLEE